MRGSRAGGGSVGEPRSQFRPRGVTETVKDYLSRFKATRNRCFVRIPKSEFAKIAFNGLNYKTRDHFENRQFANLFDLGVRVAQ